MRFIINLSSILLIFFLFNACSAVQTKVDQKTKEEQDLLSTYIGKDIEEAFRTGIRETDEFHLSVKTYYKWIKHQKKIIYEDQWNQENKLHYSEDKRLKYRSRNGTGLLTIQKLLK